VRTKTRLTPPWRRRHADTQPRAASAVPVDEAAAFVAARRGDLRAWESLIRWNQELVFRSAYLTTRDTTSAEETTTLVFIHAYRSLHSLETVAGLRPWLLRLTDTVAHTRLREMTQQRDGRMLERAPTPRVAATPVELAPGTPTLTGVEREALVDAFSALMKEERDIIAARYAFGLGRDAAATWMAIESDALDGVLPAALARLRTRALTSMTNLVDQDQGAAPVAPGRIGALSEDQLGSVSVAAVFSELPWTPDVAVVVCDRVARESAAYPEMRTESLGAVATSGQTAQASSKGTRPRPSRRSGPPGLQGVAVLLGMVLVVGAFAFGGDLVGQGSIAPDDVRVALGTLFGNAPASQPAAIGATEADASPEASMTAPGSTSTPMTSRPAVSLVDARRLKGGALAGIVRVAWPTHLDAAATVSADLEYSAGDSDWVQVDWDETGDPLLATIKPGTPVRFRVRALDAAGNQSVSDVSLVKLGVRGAGSNLVDRSKRGWTSRQGPSGRRRLVATRPGARLGTEFDGTDVAIVGPSRTSPGALDVRVDDGSWVRDTVREARPKSPVLFTEGLEPGDHTIDVRAASDGLAVDAILILRSQSASA
jgi:RNA polymerase sigma-70 factor (ECF subfamily)